MLRHAPSEEARKTVQAMAGYGIPHDDIATVIGISPHTLRKHYAKELDTGQIIATSKVAQNLFRIATGEGREAVAAAIFWLKTRAGWSEYGEFHKARAMPIGKKEEAVEAAANPDANTPMGSAMQRRQATLQ
jgi:hypothetical protein